VLLGNGDGTFQFFAFYQVGGLSLANAVVADVNGDGKLDVVAVAWGTQHTNNGFVSVLLGNGDGTFEPAVTYASGGEVSVSVAIADVNGDGKPDVVVASFGSPTGPGGVVGALLGKGDGTFKTVVRYGSGGLNATSVAVADVNGDSRPDLIATNFFSDDVGVLLNNGPFLDTTPPLITLSATPKLLSPPNGKIVPVTIFGTITDTGSGVNANSAAYSVNDEYGEVQPKGAITFDLEGNYSFTVLLQASRRGADLDGRRYAVTVRAKDNAGNGASKTSVVTVPHDQGH